MTSRIRNAENITFNRENLQRFPSKVVNPVKPTVVKRTALGELGNKIHTKPIQQLNATKGGDPKKSSQISQDKKPTQVLEKKPSQVTLQKATNIKKETTVTVKELKVLKKETTNKTELPRKEQPQKKLKDKKLADFKSIVSTSSLNCLHSNSKETNETVKVGVSYSSQQLVNVIDVDLTDKNDPLLLGVYVKDIYSYLLELELKNVIKEHFLDGHSTTPRMRCILVNWMVEVAISFSYLIETMQMSVAIVDRYLQQNQKVDRETLQLVGSTALLIAGKYEELYWPEVQEIVYICDDMYSRQQILEMERDILKKLNFDFSRPLPIHFLRRYSKVANVTPEEHSMGKYFLEICLIEYNLCHYRPSYQAAAAFCLVRCIFKEKSDPSAFWTETMEYYSDHEYSSFKSIIPKLAAAVTNIETSKYQAIRKKYASSKFGKISLHPKLKGDSLKKLTS